MVSKLQLEVRVMKAKAHYRLLDAKARKAHEEYLDAVRRLNSMENKGHDSQAIVVPFPAPR